MIVTEPDRAPAADGVKFTLIVQLAPGAILAPDAQVLLVMLKSMPLITEAPNTSETVPVLLRVTV